MSDYQATWLHLFIITEYCNIQGLQVCLVIAGLPCHSKTALPCHSKTAGQVCRASLPGKSAGHVRSEKISHWFFKVWSCLITSDHVWSRLIMSDQVFDHVWSCLIKFDQLSADIVPSLIKGRPNNNNNNKAKCIPGGTLRVLAGKNTVTIEQWALIKHCLWMTKMVTHSKIVDPWYILHENMPF
jgi:hypothetical protein